MEIEVEGIASHAGSAPEAGVSAIAVASLAVADLHRQGWHGPIHKNGRFGTSNVGVIHGGQATNVVTPKVEIRAEARSHDPAFRRQIVRAIEKAFEKAARSVRNADGMSGKVRIDGRLDYEAFLLPDDEPCVLAAEAAVKNAGMRPIRAVCNGGLDAHWITARGIPAVVAAGLLPVAVGIQGARELAYPGAFWDADKAERTGLVQSVVPADELEAAVGDLVDRLSRKPPAALATQKEIIHKWMTTDLEAAIDFSINTVVLNWLTKDQEEGMASFIEKRDPAFEGGME